MPPTVYKELFCSLIIFPVPFYVLVPNAKVDNIPIHNKNALNVQLVGTKTHEARTNATNVQAGGYPMKNEEIASNHRGLFLKSAKTMSTLMIRHL